MSEQTVQLSHEQLRQLAKQIRSQLPAGLSYCLLVWPSGEPEDFGYFSNSPKAESLVALESLLGHGFNR
jgi:hypothetical protein